MSNLLRKASIITTPTAYAEDYLYSIKPAIPFGEELVVNGNFATDSDWTKTSGAVISNGVATITVTSGYFQSIAQSISLSNTKKYRITAVVNGTSGKAVTFVDNSANNGGLTTSNGVITFNGQDQNVDITWTANTNSAEIEIIRNGSGDFSFTVDSVSVKELTDADFDFTRNSTGTRVNEDYLIEDVPYNICRNTEVFNNWTKIGTPTIEDNNIIAPNGTLTGAKVTRGSNSTLLRLGSVTFLNQEYTFSIYAKKGNHNQIRLDIGDEAGALYTLTDDWQRFTVTSTPTANTHIDITLPSSTSGDFIYIWGAQVVKGDQPKDYLKTTDRLDIPRIDYTNGEPSILLEPSRTNLITYSLDFKNRWTLGSNTTVTENYAISPEGIQNASRIQTPSGAGSFASLAAPMSSGTAYAFSIYIKNNGGESLNIGVGSSAASGVDGAETIVIPTNEWVRYEVLFTADANSNYVAIDNRSNTKALDCLIYGAQVEAGSYATSLIHTSGSAVTRSADAATNAGNNDLINSTEGVLYCEIAALADDNAVDKRISISDGTNSNRVLINIGNGISNIYTYYYAVSGSNQVNRNITVTDITEYHKLAVTWKANEFKIYLDGSLNYTDTSGSVNPAGTFTQVQFTDGNGSGNPFVGKVKALAVFKEALTDEELACLTSPNNNEIFLNYYNRMQYVNATTEAMGCAQKTYTI